MTDKISENKTITTESEIGSNGVGNSTVGKTSGESVASPEELTLALEASQATITALTKQLEDMKKKSSNVNSDDSVNRLADILANVITAKTVASGPTESDNLNRTTDFSQRNLVDGHSLMEAQETLLMYKNEETIPISIPKTFANQFGPSLPVSVNGVRVSIPCDGKTYFINKTHAEAAKERMAKVDRLLADIEPQIIETNA